MKASDNITMQTTLESVLKDDIMESVVLEADDTEAEPPKASEHKQGEPVATPKQIGGLTNLGKTFLWSEKEVGDRHEYAEAQMIQKYGAEIYGSSAQLNGGGVGSSLISCTVNRFVNLKHIKKEAGDKGYGKFGKEVKNLKDAISNLSKNERVKKNYGVDNGFADKAKQMIALLDKFKPIDGKPDKVASQTWAEISKLLKGEPWNVLVKKDSNFKSTIKNLNANWTAWNGGDSNADKNLKDKGNQNSSGIKSDVDGDNGSNDPAQSMRIIIETKFNEDWYKKKFKSGFLNKAIDTVKTSIHAHADVTKDNDEFRNKKFSADQMEPSDERKLDSMKWKMTNKVTKDYISLLLGWSRKKEYTDKGNGNEVLEELKPDKGFGDSLAKKALGGRGILGRLKQKLFAGGQNSNTISVAFQLADPNDGWTFVESEKTDVGEDKNDGKEDGKSDGSSSGSTGGGASGGKGGSSSGSSGSGAGAAAAGSGSSGQNGGSGGGKGSTPFGLSSDSPMLAPITADQAQKNPKDATGNLAARVKRIEDEVYAESTDPFYEDFMEERMELVKEVCEGKQDVDSLIEHCLLGE